MAPRKWSEAQGLPFSRPLRGVRLAGEEAGIPQEAVRFTLEQRRHAREMAAREEEDARRRRELLETISAQARAIPGMVEERLRQWRPFLVELALKAAQTVLHRALDRGDYDLAPPVAELLDRALKITTGSGIKVLVNPADLDLVCRGGAGGSLDRVTLEASPRVERGSCLIQTDEGRLSFDPEEFFRETADLIREELAHG